MVNVNINNVNVNNKDSCLDSLKNSFLIIHQVYVIFKYRALYYFNNNVSIIL